MFDLICGQFPLPLPPRAALSSTVWLQWNVMTTVGTKRRIHGPPAHSGSFAAGSLRPSVWRWPLSIQSPITHCFTSTPEVHVIAEAASEPIPQLEAEILPDRGLK